MYLRALLLLLATGVNAELFELGDIVTTKPPLWEPTLDEYFPVQRGGSVDENGLASPVVLTAASHAEFFMHARKGYPIIVSDWAANMTYDGWTCKDFAETFPFGWMKAEYIDHMPGFNPTLHDIRMMDGEKRFNLGSFKPDGKVMWHNFSRPASPRYGDDPLKPQQGPYVWHVKDELPMHEKELVQKRFDAPSFLSDPLNKAFMNRTFELWFSPGPQTGAGAHNDGYCESVVSYQVNGDKKWRQMMMPEMTFFDSFDEFDGGVYNAGKWAPDLGFVNSRSSAVIWPPGYLHETSTLPTKDGSCSASVTAQYGFPQPVQFIRTFLPRLSLSSEVGHCVARTWNGYASFFVAGIQPSGKGELIRKQHAKVLKELDSNSDGTVDVKEATAYFSRLQSMHEEAHTRYPPEHHDLFYKFKAEDTVAYHDLDGDMKASSQEILDALVQWNVVRVRIQHGLRLINEADRVGLEDFERSLDHMRRTPAKIPTKLRQELQAVLNRPKGQPLFHDLERQGVHSLSDQDFWSRVLEMIHGHGMDHYEQSNDEDDDMRDEV